MKADALQERIARLALSGKFQFNIVVYQEYLIVSLKNSANNR